MTTRIVVAMLVAVGVLGLAGSARAQNLFTNSDMEMCPALPHNTPPTGWGNDSSSAGADCDYWNAGTDPGIHQGARAPRTQLGHVEGMTQVVPTTIGVRYTVSFFAAGNGGRAEIRLGSRTGALVGSAALTGAYAQVSGSFVASATSTTIYIGTDLTAATGDARVDLACVSSSGNCEPPPTCGDGAQTSTETCDDGNTLPGDGCSGACQIEPGYTCPSPAGMPCVDIDECAGETHDCHAYATCTNTPGAFTCACDAGYRGDGRTCVDVDECAEETDDCHADATCTNTPGAFSCACNPGYAGDGRSCANIGECAEGTDDCHADATCTDTPGSFTCACNVGYEGDGRSCADVDECAAGTDDCHAQASCTNTVGAFECACEAGYAGDGRTCTNIGECAEGTDDCHANATCTDTPGSFTCTCNDGYIGDGHACADVDECADGAHDCDPNATCSNTDGAFECACDAGFVGDGRRCEPIDAGLGDAGLGDAGPHDAGLYDASVGDAEPGERDAGLDPMVSGGCNCSVSRPVERRHGWLSIGLASALVLRRRRRGSGRSRAARRAG